MGGGGVVDLGFHPCNPTGGTHGGEKEGRRRKLHRGEIIGRGKNQWRRYTGKEFTRLVTPCPLMELEPQQDIAATSTRALPCGNLWRW
jgi:hypothetical protein